MTSFHDEFAMPSSEPFFSSSQPRSSEWDVEQDDTDTETESYHYKPVKNQSADTILSKTKETLAHLRKIDLDLDDFLAAVSGLQTGGFMEPEIEYAYTHLMRSKRVPDILDSWYTPKVPDFPSGLASFIPRVSDATARIEQFALRVMRIVIRRETNLMAPIFKRNTEVNEGDHWVDHAAEDLHLKELVSEVREGAPYLWKILHVAGLNPRQKHDPEDLKRSLVLLQIVSMLMYHRKIKCNRLTRVWSVYLKSCGLTARAFDSLHRIGVVLSHSWTSEAFGKLSDRAMHQVKKMIANKRTFFMCHDNMQLSIRVQSQRSKARNQDQFHNLTVTNVYVLPESVFLPPEIRRLVQSARKTGSASPFNLKSLLTDTENRNRGLRVRHSYRILRILLDSPAFKKYKHHEAGCLAPPPPIEQLSRNRADRPEMFVLRTEEIDEASYDGTEQLVTEYLKQMGIGNSEKRQWLSTQFIGWCGDQLTVERLRGIFEYRYNDSNTYLRWDWMQPIFGWFHFLMAAANSVYEQHLGNAVGVGLRNSFNKLGRKHLDSRKTKGPFWHHLNEALHHIADAHFRACWLVFGKVKTLDDLLNKSPQELLRLADQILRQQVSTEALQELIINHTAEKQDECYYATVMLRRDLLTYLELRSALKAGDVGRIDALIPTYLYRFSGGSESKYTIELMELLQAYQEWPPEVREYIRCHCWLINTSGQENSFVPVDQKQEHTIRDLKYTWRSMGPSAQLSYIQKISPAIPKLRGINRQMERQFDAFKRGSRHKAPDKEQDVMKLMTMYISDEVHCFKEGRKLKGEGKSGKPPVDVITQGATNLWKSGTITQWWDLRDFERSENETWAAEETVIDSLAS